MDYIQEANTRCEIYKDIPVVLKNNGSSYSIYVNGNCIGYGFEAKEACLIHQMCMVTYEKAKQHTLNYCF